MPIDPDKALGAAIPPEHFRWTADSVILYHLGLGAGASATDSRELAYVFERGLRVLPSFGVLPAFRSVPSIMRLPGIDFDATRMLHGEHELEIHGPIPIAGEVVTEGRISGVYDKRIAALIILELETRDDDGQLLFVNRFSLYARGEGGFGGAPGPRVVARPPARAPDHVVESPTLPQQALLYRLSGDKNPLHSDPEFAKLGGFDAPILHGLCSFGMVCKAAVDHALEGDTARVARYRSRFAGVVYPGETLVTSIWEEAGRLLVSARTRERGTPVLTHGLIELR